LVVIAFPAKAGTQGSQAQTSALPGSKPPKSWARGPWVPAFAGKAKKRSDGVYDGKGE